jgi:uncharacterized DUF497 family protein
MIDIAEVAGFDWDTGNWPKCAKHGLSQDEIETVFLGDPAIYAHPAHSIAEQRLRAIGQNEAGRWVYVSFTLRHKDDGVYIRPVSARYMHQKEVSRYEQEAP